MVDDVLESWKKDRLILLCSLCVAFSFCDRVNMSVAVVDMSEEFGWSLAERGQVLGAFFYGYVLSQIGGAILAHMFGGYLILGVSLILLTSLTFAFPLLIGKSLKLVILARMSLGLVEGCIFPVVYHILGSKVSGKNRSGTIATITTGVFAGSIFAYFVSPLLMHTYGWRSIFWFFGCLGASWCVAWIQFCFKHADEDGVYNAATCSKRKKTGYQAVKRNSSTELETGEHSINFPRAIRRILSHKTVLAIIVCHFCHNIGSFVMMSWMPTYFQDALGLSGKSLILTCLPIVSTTIAIQFTSRYADAYIAKNSNQLCKVRKYFTVGGLAASATFLLLIPTSNSVVVSVALLCLALSCNGASPAAGYEAAKLDVASPKYIGILQSLSNTIAAFAGVIGVPAVGIIKEQTGSWNMIFVCMAVLLYLAAFVFHIWADYTGILID